MRVKGLASRSLAPVCLAVLVSACSAVSSTTAPVVTSTSDGKVAAAGSDCPQGPPARGALSDLSWNNDGLVGSIRNEEVGPIWVKLSGRGEACRLPVNASTAYATAGSGTLNLWSDKEGGDYQTDLKMWDPIWYDWPQVSGPGHCGSAQKTVRLSEGESAMVTGGIEVKRLPEAAGAAREWAGVSGSYVDDWARIDVVVTHLTRCR